VLQSYICTGGDPCPLTQEALLLLVGAESTEYGPLSGLVVSSDPSEYTEVLLEGFRAGFSGSLPTLNGTYTLQQHSSQAEVSLCLQETPLPLDAAFS